MFVKLFSLSLISLLCTSIYAQTDEVLFTLADKKISKNEFVSFFKKNHNGRWINEKDSIQKSLNQFIDFKLKLEDAQSLGLDKTEKFKEEIDSYSKQLIREYSLDKDEINFYVMQTYERAKTEVHIRHILIRLDPHASAKDSLFAYQKALNIRKRLMNGADFGTLAAQISDDPSASISGGDLWYVKPGLVPYAIENYIYGNKIEKYSFPIRTEFGYHIIEILNKRPNPGRYKVSHIMLSLTNDTDKNEEALIKQKADSIYKLALNGADFAQLALKFSDDKGTSSIGGELPWFETGKMPHEFEEECLKLSYDGAISNPVKTKYGWHIIKRISQKDNPPLDQIKEQLSNLVLEGEKGKIIEARKIEKLKKTYQFKDFYSITQFINLVDSTIFVAEWKVPENVDLSGQLFLFDNHKFYQKDFAEYLQSTQRKMYPIPLNNYIDTKYLEFQKKSIIEKEEQNIENRNSTFKAVLKEYSDGILIFDVMEKQVWAKALEDKSGLADFYRKNKEIYNNFFFADICIYSYGIDKTNKIEKQFKKLKESNLSENEIEKNIQDNIDKNFMFMRCTQKEEGKDELVDECIKLEKNGALKKDERVIFLDNQKTMIWLNKEIKKSDRPLEEINALVAADYQNYLENTWISELRKKYPVKINHEVLESIINQ